MLEPMKRQLFDIGFGQISEINYRLDTTDILPHLNATEDLMNSEIIIHAVNGLFIAFGPDPKKMSSSLVLH